MKNGYNHVTYYIGAFFMRMTPRFIVSIKEKMLMRAYETMDKKYIEDRVNYYNRLQGVTELPTDSRQLKDHTYANRKGASVYFFDSYEFTRFFPKHLHWIEEPGDVNWLFDKPSITTTRPLTPEDKRFNNSVIFKVEKARHFFFIKDPVPFEQKKKEVIFRGDVYGKPKRIDFL